MADVHMKRVAHQEEWGRVLAELNSENLKLASYDDTLIPLLSDVRGKCILDYGAGPGVLALALRKLGADVHVWDIDPEMRRTAAEKIGSSSVYESLEQIPLHRFDVVICNLVLCIVPEDEVRRIVVDLRRMLNDDGKAYVGFCNPLLFNVAESRLDFRFPTGNEYDENHDYKKIKKEGGYEIIESHRPMEWYEAAYEAAGLKREAKHFTREYEMNGSVISDFVIFELSCIA